METHQNSVEVFCLLPISGRKQNRARIQDMNKCSVVGFQRYEALISHSLSIITSANIYMIPEKCKILKIKRRRFPS